MFIVWGSKGFHEKLGQLNHTLECGNCHNQMYADILKVGRKFTLFWIPLFTTSSQHYLACPVCSAGVEISKEDAEYYYQLSQQPRIVDSDDKQTEVNLDVTNQEVTQEGEK